jgi:hypothetical protein
MPIISNNREPQIAPITQITQEQVLFFLSEMSRNTRSSLIDLRNLRNLRFLFCCRPNGTTLVSRHAWIRRMPII